MRPRRRLPPLSCSLGHLTHAAAIPRSIGTGLFIGSGGVYATGGPGFLMLDYLLIATMLLCVVLDLGEMGTLFPVSGSFAAYSTRFISPAWGFAMGWNYWMQWFVVLPLELTAASIVIKFWDPEEHITPGVWLIIFIAVITIINFFGVRGYGEFESFASIIKILAVLGFIICGSVISAGGTPSHQNIGNRYWSPSSAAFKNGFQGFCSVFTSAAFAFAGTELIGLAAAESHNPRKDMPKAAKQVFFRIMLFYVASLLVITLIVSPDEPRLTGGTSSYDARASPFVIALQIGNIHALPSVFNAVILISVLSVGNSAVYGASRTLTALAQQGLAPPIFKYIDRKGRPLPSVILSLAMGFLSFLIYSTSQTDVFDWLMALSGLSTIFSWGSITFSHLRFRQAWAHHGRTIEELPWKAPTGVVGSIWGTLFCTLVVIFEIIIGCWPIGSDSMDGSERAVTFFQDCLCIPVVALFLFFGLMNWTTVFRQPWNKYYIGRVPVCAWPSKVWADTKWRRIEDIDISTGIRLVPLDILRQERADSKQQPWAKKIWNFFF